MKHGMFVDACKSIISITITLFLGACATPNIKPFADQTTSLASAVAAEHKQIAAGWDVLNETLDDKQKSQYSKQQASFKKSTDAINGLLQQAVAYSERLVELADAGEKGAEAADSLLETAKKFGTVEGIPGLVASDAAAKVLEKIAAVASRIEAQKSLEEATRKAQPAVDMLADGVEELEKELPTLVRTLGREQSRTVTERVGPNLVGLYEAVTEKRESIYSGIWQKVKRFNPANGFCVDDNNNDDRACKVSKEFKAIDDLNNIVKPIESSYGDYNKRQASIRAWTSERVSKSKDIGIAAKAWAEEHKKIADILQKCGGFRAIKCQDFGASKLKVAVFKLKTELKQGD